MGRSETEIARFRDLGVNGCVLLGMRDYKNVCRGCDRGVLPGVRHYAEDIVQGRMFSFAVLTMLLARLPVLGAARTPGSQCGVSPQEGWREFVDQARGFCFWYPASYRLGVSISGAGSQQDRQSLATFKSRVPRRATADDKGVGQIEVWRLPGTLI